MAAPAQDQKADDQDDDINMTISATKATTLEDLVSIEGRIGGSQDPAGATFVQGAGALTNPPVAAF